MTTTLTREVLVLRGASGGAPPPAPQWCASCGGLVLMVTPEAAAVVSGVSPRTIYRWVEAGHVHFAEGADGRLLVCSVSLPCAAD